MFVYVVLYGASYEGDMLLGVFSDYVKARECEVKYSARFAIGKSEYEWVEVRKVELDKLYEDWFQGIGEEM